MSLRADDTIAVLVYDGTVISAHMRGRHRDGKLVVAFGRSWRVVKIIPSDGARLVELRAEPSDGPIMCSSCGSFEIERSGQDAPYKCLSCHRHGPGTGCLL
jgi:hypothetical protein